MDLEWESVFLSITLATNHIRTFEMMTNATKKYSPTRIKLSYNTSSLFCKSSYLGMKVFNFEDDALNVVLRLWSWRNPNITWDNGILIEIQLRQNEKHHLWEDIEQRSRRKNREYSRQGGNSPHLKNLVKSAHIFNQMQQ